jgi:hypothetical protein
MAFVKALTATLGTISLMENFYSLKEDQMDVGEWVRKMSKENPFRDTHVRRHRALGYSPPASKTQVPQLIQNQSTLL